VICRRDHRRGATAAAEGVVSPVTPNLPPHVFGCVAFIHLYKHQRNKLQPWASGCVFIAYATHQKGYRCYHPPTQKIFVMLDMVFHEDSMYFSRSDLQREY